MGIVVDAVSEVLNIKSGEIEDNPSLGAQREDATILGLAKAEGGIKILLNIDQVLSAEERAVLAEAA
jgi:purine-binding chemotaxis protein CheW